MSAPIRLKSSDGEVFVKKGGDFVIIGTGDYTDEQIAIAYDEIPELISVLLQIIKDEK